MIVDDALIDGVEVCWVDDGPWSGTRVTVLNPELRVINDYLARTTWNDLPSIIRDVDEQVDLDINGSGFSFEDGIVTLHDPLDDLTLRTPAFLRLMLRFFLAVRAGVDHAGARLDHEPWWAEFVERLEHLQLRLAGAA